MAGRVARACPPGRAIPPDEREALSLPADGEMISVDRNLIRAIKAERRTVLLTTHYMEEAYFLCDEIAIMDRGRIIAQGAPSRLLKEHFDDVVLELPREDFPGEPADFPMPLLLAGDRVEIDRDGAPLHRHGLPPKRIT